MIRTATARHTDEELVRRCRKGDREAFDGLILRYRKEIYRIAYRITGDPEEADDLAQETFCRAFTGLEQFRGDSSVRTWLYRIVSNLSLNVVRSARTTKREFTSPEALAERGDAAVVQGPVALEGLLERERRRRVREAIGSLPPKQRMTLILKAFEGLPYGEIAQIMRCSPGTSKANFFHAVTALRKAIKEDPR